MELKRNINKLKISYILQIISLIIIIILNVLYKNKIDWINEILVKCFYAFFYCLIVITIFIVIFFIIIFFKNNYAFFFKLFKLSTSIYIFRLIISTGFFVIYIITYINVDKFFDFCPFNFDLSDLISIFPNLNDNNVYINYNSIEKKCSMKRCIEINKNEKEYSYICNFNSEKKGNINCIKLSLGNFDENISNILISYINLCNIYMNMYLCKTSNKPKEFSIESDYNCPKIKNKPLALLIILIILNLIFPISIYIFQYTYYKKILIILVSQEIQNNNNNKNANNTIDTSKIIDSNIDDYKSSKTNKIFKKEKTEVIIIDNDEINVQNIIQILSKDTKRKKTIKKYKNDLVLRINKKKNFKNQREINYKKNLNKSFTKNNDNSNILEYNSIRKLTEINRNNDESEKKEKVQNELKCIIINNK